MLPALKVATLMLVAVGVSLTLAHALLPPRSSATHTL